MKCIIFKLKGKSIYVIFNHRFHCSAYIIHCNGVYISCIVYHHCIIFYNATNTIHHYLTQERRMECIMQLSVVNNGPETGILAVNV